MNRAVPTLDFDSTPSVFLSPLSCSNKVRRRSSPSRDSWTKAETRRTACLVFSARCSADIVPALERPTARFRKTWRTRPGFVRGSNTICSTNNSMIFSLASPNTERDGLLTNSSAGYWKLIFRLSSGEGTNPGVPAKAAAASTSGGAGGAFPGAGGVGAVIGPERLGGVHGSGVVGAVGDEIVADEGAEQRGGDETPVSVGVASGEDVRVEAAGAGVGLGKMREKIRQRRR
mmetsp:Transcript_8659/g.16776  ORF Transcript_8659/g.16776 Transcript_8659/m.16776 type:complete len:231 (-) Transcript_8659:503-1195(-)